MTNDSPCRCDVYTFPHRVGAGKCKQQFPVELDDEALLGYEERYLDDKARAADMNAAGAPYAIR